MWIRRPQASGKKADRLAQDREIFRLALPAFATLVSEPLLLLADSAIIGHLGTTQLAGLALAANLLGIVTGLCIFLAYGTTGTVARMIGAGDQGAAIAHGFDGIVLALLLGAGLAVVLELLLPTLIAGYGPEPAIAAAALSYLRIAVCGLPAILVVLAGTGVLRGLQDTVTPLAVVITANVVNIGLNLLLVYAAGLGMAGSALGTLIAQSVAAAILAAVVLVKARRRQVQLRFRPRAVLHTARSGGWLVLRTGALQAGITLTTAIAATGGAVMLAAHQVVSGIWILLAFGLDAIAIAGQAIIGRALGAGDAGQVRAMTRRMLGWGAIIGVLFGALIWLGRPVFVGWFTADPEVQDAIGEALLVVALLTPIAGLVYVLDGVLIGAGDGRYLALAGVLALLAYVPVALLVARADGSLTLLWLAYGWYATARLITLALRARGHTWLRLGA